MAMSPGGSARAGAVVGDSSPARAESARARHGRPARSRGTIPACPSLDPATVPQARDRPDPAAPDGASYPRNVAAARRSSRSSARASWKSRHRGHVVQVGCRRGRRRVGRRRPGGGGHAPLRGQAVRAGRAHRIGCRGRPRAVRARSSPSWPPRTRARTSTCARSRRCSGAPASASRCWPAAPAHAASDRVTAARLARDGEEPGPMRHQCSGFHAASLLLSRFADWSLEDYASSTIRASGPSARRWRGCSGRRRKALPVGVDDCGLATYAFPLVGRRARVSCCSRTPWRPRPTTRSGRGPCRRC